MVSSCCTGQYRPRDIKTQVIGLKILMNVGKVDALRDKCLLKGLLLS